MEIKNAQQTIITMDNKEFEGLKQLIKATCTITKPVIDELDNAFPAESLCNKLYDIATTIFHEDGWCDFAWDVEQYRYTHGSFTDERHALYKKIQNMYHASIKMPEMFTEEELNEIKFRYGLMIEFEYAMCHLANAGLALNDVVCAMDDRGCRDWVYELVDREEGGK